MSSPALARPPCPEPTSAHARQVCESPRHRARLRQYASAGRLSRDLNLLPDTVDFDLSAAGYIQRVDVPFMDRSTVAFRITRQGEVRLFEWTQHRRDRNAVHHDLGADLAQWLRSSRNRVTWENVQFEFRDPADVALPSGAAALHLQAGVLRPDVFSIVATLDESRMAPQVHEIKVSRADFLRDLAQPGKRAAYFRMAPQVLYATPVGLVDKSEIPVECGWMECLGPGRWRVSKAAPRVRKWTGLGARQWLAMVLKPHQAPACSDGEPAL